VLAPWAWVTVSTAARFVNPGSRASSKRYRIDSAGPVISACCATRLGVLVAVVAPPAGELGVGAPITTGV